MREKFFEIMLAFVAEGPTRTGDRGEHTQSTDDTSERTELLGRLRGEWEKKGVQIQTGRHLGRPPGRPCASRAQQGAREDIRIFSLSWMAPRKMKEVRLPHPAPPRRLRTTLFIPLPRGTRRRKRAWPRESGYDVRIHGDRGKYYFPHLEAGELLALTGGDAGVVQARQHGERCRVRDHGAWQVRFLLPSPHHQSPSQMLRREAARRGRHCRCRQSLVSGRSRHCRPLRCRNLSSHRTAD